MSCPYARIFEPPPVAEGPSGLADWPRPFVFRATHLDGCTLTPGTRFHFGLNLFDPHAPAISCLVLAFAQLARYGLGPVRSKVELITVEQLDENGEPSTVIYGSVPGTITQSVAPLQLNLTHGENSVDRLRIRFLTPTELKNGQQLAAKPEFGILAARVRDRISTLRQLYGPGPLQIDFRSFGERANAVRMTRSELRQVNVQRQSSRTGQVHSIGGFVGEADYEGDLTEFIPYLKAARWTGVGRQTVWGKGEIAVDVGCS